MLINFIEDRENDGLIFLFLLFDATNDEVMKKLTVSFLCKFQRKSDLGKWLLHTRGHTVPLALT